MRLLSLWCLMALAALAAPESPPAPVLSYSGDDIAAGPGTMTIRCAQADRPLWELDLVRTKDGKDVRLMRFDDLLDRADFNYGMEAGSQYVLFMAHNRSGLDAESFTELHKGDDYYEYVLREIYASCTVVTRYRIGAADKTGTRIVATRTMVNTTGGPLAPLPSGIMNAAMSLGVKGYDGRRKDGNCTLTDCDDKGVRHHQQSDGKDAIWEVTDNCWPQGNPKYDRQSVMWCEARVKRSTATKALGLAVGRRFRLDSDVVGYYPASSIGRIALDNRVNYTEGLHVELMPREWFGKERQDHNNVGLPADASATKTFTLSINIAGK